MGRELGLFQQFHESWKQGEKWPKLVGWPVGWLVGDVVNPMQLSSTKSLSLPTFAVGGCSTPVSGVHEYKDRTVESRGQRSVHLRMWKSYLEESQEVHVLGSALCLVQGTQDHAGCSSC